MTVPVTVSSEKSTLVLMLLLFNKSLTPGIITLLTISCPWMFSRTFALLLVVPQKCTAGHGSSHGSLDGSSHGSPDGSSHRSLDGSSHGSLDGSSRGSLDGSSHGCCRIITESEVFDEMLVCTFSIFKIELTEGLENLTYDSTPLAVY